MADPTNLEDPEKHQANENIWIENLWKEWDLFKYYFWRLCFSLVFSLYFCDIVTRRLAYYIHAPISHYVRNENEDLVEIPRLEDFGHKLLPDWGENEIILTLNEYAESRKVLVLCNVSSLNA